MMPTRQGNFSLKLILAIAVISSGCISSPSDKLTETKNPVIMLPSIVDITPTETPVPTPFQQAEITIESSKIAPCLNQPGSVSHQIFRSRILHGDFKFSIYMPPCYKTSADYPILYLMHGLTYTDDQWIRLGITSVADQLIRSEEIKPLIIVMPYNPGSTLPPTNSFGRVLVEELMPKIESEYSVCTDKSCRMIGGLSRGGGWAYDIYVHNPGVFAKVAGHSPAMFKHDARYLVWWIKNAYQSEDLWLDIGDKDPETGYIQDIQRLLEKEDIPVTVNIWPGVHDETYWQTHVEDYLRWYMQGY